MRAPERGWDDYRDFVNPLVWQRAELSGEPYRIVAVEGGRLRTAGGRLVDDLLSGYGTQAFGHRHPAVAAAVRAFLDGAAPSFHTSSVSPWAGSLARRLCERAGAPYGSAFFASGGAEAVEAALKLARAATRRPRILHLEGAYHGCTYGSVSLMASGAFREPFGPFLAGVQELPFADAAALERELAGGDVAAVVVEPLQVEGGVRELPPAYVEEVCRLTALHGAVLVADEIQVGLGRLGRFLATEAWPRRPDVVVLGKALGGGLVPVSCALSSRALRDRAYGSHALAEAHNSTFGGNALACVAALAALELLTGELLASVRRKGELLRRALSEALDGSPLVAGIRGEGLLAGIELAPVEHPWLRFDALGAPELAHQPSAGLLLCERLWREGFLAGVCGHRWGTVRVQPAFDVPEERLEAFAKACRAGLDALARVA